MRYQRVFLIFPSYEGRDMGALHPPLGIGYLAETLSQAGVEHDCIDMRLGEGPQEVIKRIKRFAPDLVGVSMMTLLHRRSYELIRAVKQKWPDLAVAIGGPHASTMRAACFEECPEIDYVLVMEAEHSLLELCQGKELSSIEGIAFRSGGEIAYTGDAPFVFELDKIPFPKYGKFQLGRYLTREIGILTSRGCPYKCTYCPVSTVIGRRFRVRSPEHIVQEIGYWYEQGYRHFDIIDDVFNLRRDRVLEVCDAIERLGLRDVQFKCGNGIRADRLTPEIMGRMREVGFKQIAFGVEAGNDRVLKAIKKGESIEVVKRAIELACKLGFDVTLFFIVGNPTETLADVEDSIRIALSYPVFDVRFYNVVPFPGTDLYDWANENHLFRIDPKEYLNDVAHFDHEPIIETPEFPATERRKALRIAARVRKEVRQRAMAEKLSRLGPMGAALARIYVGEFIQNRLLHNRFVRRKARRFYDLMVPLG